MLKIYFVYSIHTSFGDADSLFDFDFVASLPSPTGTFSEIEGMLCIPPMFYVNK
jgi:hypothetical protein